MSIIQDTFLPFDERRQSFSEISMMSNNPILDELHAIREKLLAEAGGDLHRYVAEARERALASGRPLVEPVHRATWPVAPPVPHSPDSQSQQAPLDAFRQ